MSVRDASMRAATAADADIIGVIAVETALNSVYMRWDFL
jgi:hypothetical protein